MILKKAYNLHTVFL